MNMPIDYTPYIQIIIATVIALALAIAVTGFAIAFQIGQMIESIDNERNGNSRAIPDQSQEGR